MTADRAERLWRRACGIRDDRGHGDWVSIVRHLAMRRHPDAIIDLAHWYDGGDARDRGSAADPLSAAGLRRRAWRMGNARGAYNQAMERFNRNDMAGYRHWPHRAARAGDGAAALQARAFETRLPHATARDIGRLRPVARRDALA